MINEQQLIGVNGISKYKCQVNHVMHKGFPRKFILVEELTAEILDSEKRAYGKVIRMMAHEVNNSMGAVNSILNTINDFAFNHETADLDLKSSLEVAINRNKSLGTFMDNFASVIRLPAPNKKLCNLSDIVVAMGQLFESQAEKRNIKIEYNLSKLPTFATIDRVQIEQVLSNIIKNALESIEKNGKIIISTTSSPLGFMIQDDGPGISDENAQKLFSPFHSTKVSGQGIGLVLCRDILQNHKAQFSLATNSENGLTEFKASFPKN